MTIDARELFRSRIGEAIGVPPERVALFAKGRVALYAILKALGVRPGDEVILPAFTCVAVPNAILYAGARLRYVDIDPLTYTIDPAAVEAAITPRTRVILAQNTFGLSSDLDALTAIAERHGVRIVDDCTHGLGGQYRGQPNGSIAPVSFFSTQWSKTISTGLGGFAIAQDDGIAAGLQQLEAAAPEPSAANVALLRVLLFGLEHGGHGAVFRRGRSLYRRLSHLGLVPSSSSRDELVGTTMPKGFLTRLSRAQAHDGVERIGRLRDQVARRREIAGRYSDWLSAHGRTPAAEPAWIVHAYLRYPLRVTDRPSFIAAATKAGVDLGDWFVSPIHPVLEDLERWHYRPGTAPIADGTCQEIVNLTTNPALSDQEIDRVIKFLSQHVEGIR
jgi:perosamine synthetase